MNQNPVETQTTSVQGKIYLKEKSLVKTKKLPDGWKIEESFCWDEGTGYGDDLYDPALFRWELVTVGHLWWKRLEFQWVLWRVERYSQRDLAIKRLVEFALMQEKAEAKS